MTTPKPKPIKCYGMFTNTDAIGRYTCPPYVDAMGVTSFSTLPNGTRMVHGHTANHRWQSTHRVADGMRFYQTKEAMDEAIAAMNFVTSPTSKWTVKIERLKRELDEAIRARRIEAERVLNKSAIIPLDLDR